MRFVKSLLTFLAAAIAVVVGLLTAAAIAVIGALLFLGGRVLGRTRPRVSAPPGGQRARPAASGDVIDVTATEVRTDPPTSS